MDGFPPTSDVSQELLEEAAPAASSTHHHDGELSRGERARDESANIVPFRRVVLAEAARPAGGKPDSPIIPLGVPSDADIPAHARLIIAAAVADIAPKKNVSLASDEAVEVVDAVVATLDLAELYRLAMADPATVQKVGHGISDQLDVAALRHVAAFVLHVEDKNNAHDPAIIGIVTSIVTKIALTVASGAIIWPDIATAVADYYSAMAGGMTGERIGASPSAEASHGG